MTIEQPSDSSSPQEKSEREWSEIIRGLPEIQAAWEEVLNKQKDSYEQKKAIEAFHDAWDRAGIELGRKLRE